jgi:uncharacterized protein YbjT (DUF2867 family)
MNEEKHILVFGATGNVGGSATREMLKRGWRVRGVTRNPDSEKALALGKLGAEVVSADMEDRTSLEAAFDGIKRVLSVQNWVKSGIEGEILQGKLVADAAKSAGVEHMVYLSAGTGEPNTGIPHFDNKLVVEDYIRGSGISLTIIRPAPFMELLTESEFYPALATWGVEPKILGWDTPKPWVAVRDIGIAITNAFDDPETWIGQDVELFGDVKSLGECRDVFTEIDGKKPFRLPLPIWLFRKMVEEFVQMWYWLDEYLGENGSQRLWETVNRSRKLCPDLLDLESWLKAKRNGAGSD